VTGTDLETRLAPEEVTAGLNRANIARRRRARMAHPSAVAAWAQASALPVARSHHGGLAPHRLGELASTACWRSERPVPTEVQSTLAAT